MPAGNSRRIEWVRSGLSSLRTQISYIADDNLQAAIELGERVRISIQGLAEFPGIGRIGRVANTRELSIAGSPFVVIYRVEAEAIVVLRVLHTAQQWPPPAT